MERRSFLTQGAVISTLGIMAAPAIARAQTKIKWRMPSSFPSSLETIYGGALALAERVKALTDGGFEIAVYAAGELVPALGVLEAVQAGTTEAGHSAGFYYIGKKPALAFDSGFPFGLNPRQHFAWFHKAGGRQLLDEVFAPFNVIAMPAGNTGAQMGGWFRRPIDKVGDLQGLRIRAAGYLGRIYAGLGAVPQQIAAGDLYSAMERGTLDAVEFTSPADDEKLGLNKVAKYYYAPGVLERGASLNVMVNKEAWNQLPPAYQAALEVATAAAYNELLADYDSRNVAALRRLIAGGAELRAWPEEVMDAMYDGAEALAAEEGAKDSDFARIHAHWKEFRDEQELFMKVNDTAAENFLIRKLG